LDDLTLGKNALCGRRLTLGFGDDIEKTLHLVSELLVVGHEFSSNLVLEVNADEFLPESFTEVVNQLINRFGCHFNFLISKLPELRFIQAYTWIKEV
jgi:hypothetical protein